jgi:alkanesulfonate monooxygenase SsuD/methylene tetrahydromethanopterin reductase-like flavin-dependent oxidoreductase (luciferase family)
LGEVGSGRHSEHERPAFNSPEEREFYDETVQALREEGGRSEDEIRRMADEALEEWRKYDDVPF